MNRIFIAGCGYVGHALIDQLPAGTAIGVLTHSAEHATRLRSQGVATVIGDLDHGEPLPDLSMVADRVLFYFVPPPACGITDPRLQYFLDALPAATPPLRVVLISATGVYGDCAGAWVDESREPAPESDRGRRRLHAEQTLRAWGHAQAVPIAILRVAGI